MANARIIVKRRKTVRNIRKITRTMQLIATARFQAAFNRAVATKPYTERLAELVADLTGVADGAEHPLMKTESTATRSALVGLTSHRGLCGGYNASLLRTAVAHLKDQEESGTDCDVYMSGKKGIVYLRFLGREMRQEITHIGDAPKFSDVDPIANELMDRFTRDEISAAYVVYMRFVSAGKQVPTVIQLLPLTREKSDDASNGKQGNVQYEFSPNPKELLEELLPATVRVRLFQCFTDAAASEQIARMVAMKAATEAAGDMITALTRKYNRARQTQITLELLDIVGGANALE